MQPTMPAPPVPAGSAARDAWREMGRGLRRELMRGDRPHPDPAVAVVAVGYARAMLIRPYRRHCLWPMIALIGWAIVLVIAVEIVAPEVSFAPGGDANRLVAVPVPVGVVLYVYWLRRRFLAWHRMESVHAAALWVSERRDPPPAPTAPAERAAITAAEEIVVRYDLSALRRQCVLLTAVTAAACGALAVLWGPVPALAVAAVYVAILVLGVAVAVRQAKPHLPALYLRPDGIEFPAQEVRVAWGELTEIRVVPFRTFGGKALSGQKGRNWVAVFVAADPDALFARLTPRWAKRARTSQQAYGGPLAVADVSLDRSAEEIAASAAALSGLPVRRFGEE